MFWNFFPAGSEYYVEAGMESLEKGLLGKALRGDESAFLSLYRAHQKAIFLFTLQMTGSQALAEEITQEVFIVLLERGEAFDPSRGSLAPFLYGIARNLVARVRRREGAATWLKDNLEEVVLADSSVAGDPVRRQLEMEAITRVRRVVTSLPGRYREVVVLCDLQELSYEEAARMLGCSIGTIRSRLHRARRLLKDKLKIEGGVNTRTAVTLSPGEVI